MRNPLLAALLGESLLLIYLPELLARVYASLVVESCLVILLKFCDLNRRIGG